MALSEIHNCFIHLLSANNINEIHSEFFIKTKLKGRRCNQFVLIVE